MREPVGPRAAAYFELVGVSPGRTGRSILLKARSVAVHDTDMLTAHFLPGDPENMALARELIPEELMRAALETAPGWDVGLAGERFYVQHHPNSVRPSDPNRIVDHFRMASRLAPLAVKLLRQPNRADTVMTDLSRWSAS